MRRYNIISFYRGGNSLKEVRDLVWGHLLIPFWSQRFKESWVEARRTGRGRKQWGWTRGYSRASPGSLQLCPNADWSWGTGDREGKDQSPWPPGPCMRTLSELSFQQCGACRDFKENQSMQKIPNNEKGPFSNFRVKKKKVSVEICSEENKKRTNQVRK